MSEGNTDAPVENGARDQSIEASLDAVRQALSVLRFGSVSLTVHEGRVVQIDITEKKRLKVP